MTKIQNTEQVIRLHLCPKASSPADQALRSDTIAVKVLVIEYCNLRFICYLVLEI